MEKFERARLHFRSEGPGGAADECVRAVVDCLYLDNDKAAQVKASTVEPLVPGPAKMQRGDRRGNSGEKLEHRPMLKVCVYHCVQNFRQKDRVLYHIKKFCARDGYVVVVD